MRALKYAAQLDYRPGSKIFLLFDNDATFTNSLREMIDVSGQLMSRGIILNTVNAYDMRRGTFFIVFAFFYFEKLLQVLLSPGKVTFRELIIEKKIAFPGNKISRFGSFYAK